MRHSSQNPAEGNEDDLRARVVQLEAELEQLRKERPTSEDAVEERHRHLVEQQKQEALGVLATGVAHAFNNILTGVLGYTELAARDLEPESLARDFLDEVTRAARRGAELTAQLLLHAGKGRFTLKEVNLSTVVQDMARQLLAAVPSKAVLRFESPGACPLIMGDIEMLRQLLSQLVTNAGEALGGRSGKITVRTTVREVAGSGTPTLLGDAVVPAGRYVSLAVIDTGSGMNQATLARIFEPFFTTRFIGRGLGLSAVRGIVQGHRGFIQLESKPGKGSTFEVLFPALPDKPPEQTPAQGPPVSS
jgi:signal transduction histidine kinase